jgi:Zn-dependent protease with chaperone function
MTPELIFAAAGLVALGPLVLWVAVLIPSLRAQRALLWFGTLHFYLALPLLCAGMIAATVGLTAVLGSAGVGLQVLGLLLPSLLGTLATVLLAVLARPFRQQGGILLSRADAPLLHGIVDEAAGVSGAPVPEEIRLYPDTTVAVHESGSLPLVLLGLGRRTLHLGFAAMDAMDVSTFKAVLAHELGHFSGRDTRVAPLAARVLLAARLTLSGTASSKLAFLSPIVWYLEPFERAYARLEAVHRRRAELAADRVAAQAYGGDALARGLRALEDLEARRPLLSDFFGWLLRAGARVEDAYACIRELSMEPAPPAAPRKPDPLDSHPPTEDRIRAVEGLSPREPDSRPATALLLDAAGLARQLSIALVADVAQQLLANRVRLAEPRDAPRGGDAAALHVFRLQRRAERMLEADPVGAAALAEKALSVARGLAGDDDELVVLALATAARCGAPALAQERITSARRILRRRADYDTDRDVELSRLGRELERVSARGTGPGARRSAG